MAYLKGGTYIDGGVSVEGNLKIRSIEFSEESNVALLEGEEKLRRYNVTRISNEAKTKLETAPLRVATSADADAEAIYGELYNDQIISEDQVTLNYQSNSEKKAGTDDYKNVVATRKTNKGRIADLVAAKANDLDDINNNYKEAIRFGVENNFLLSLYAEYGATATDNRSATFEIGNRHIFARSEAIQLAPDGRTWIFK